MAEPFVQLLGEAIQPPPGRRGWHGGPTPAGALRGVGAAEAAWVPPGLRHSIWALALHVAYWDYAVRRRLEGGTAPRFPRAPANWPRVPAKPQEAQWRLDVALLVEEHRRLVKAVAALPASRYASRVPAGRRWRLGELVTGIALHDAYHAGQIQLVKRLWKGRTAPRRAPASPAAIDHRGGSVG